MAQKGDLLSVREDIRVVDATIRDGGLCNNFEFPDEFVKDLYKANVKAGVDYMEFGIYGCSVVAFCNFIISSARN